MPATRKEKETKKKKRRVDVRPSDPAPGQSSKKIKGTGHPPPAPATPQNGSTSKSITETPSGPEDKPANWPTEVQYLSEACIPSPNLPAHFKPTFCHPFPPSHPPLPLSHLSIRPITALTPFRRHPLLQNTTHPALGQHGLFAEVDLPGRRLVCAYLGVVHGEEETDGGSEYDAQVWARGTGEVLGFERDVGLGIDATYAGNLGRYEKVINDFRGIAQRANVTFEDWPSSASSEGGEGNQPRGLALYTGPAGVAAGAELCVSYGKAFWEARGVLPATGTASRPP